MEQPAKEPLLVLVASDGTGETAEKVVRAGLRQFSGYQVHVRVFPHIERPDEITRLFRICARSGGLIVTTLVADRMREHAARHAAELQVRHVDLIGPVLDKLGESFDQDPVQVPGLLHRADDEYYRRIEAIEFTVRADDGKDPRMLREADIILVGVSRTSKTPLSTYLAHKGYKVGNQPIVLERPFPPQLFEVDQGRIFALTIDPRSLQNIRRTRLQTMRMPAGTNYSDMDYILAELEYAERLFRGNPRWPVIDVTNKAIEETAATIARRLQERGFDGPIGEASQL